MSNCPLLSLPTALLRYTLGFLVGFFFGGRFGHQWALLSRVCKLLDVKRWAHTLAMDSEIALTHRLHVYTSRMMHLKRIAIITNLEDEEVRDVMNTRTREILEVGSQIEVLHVEFPIILRVNSINSVRFLHLQNTNPICLEGLYLPHLRYCDIWDHGLVKSIDFSFAPHLQHLSLHRLESLRRVHKLPQSLETLDLCRVDNLSIHPWPLTLRKLIIEYMDNDSCFVIPRLNGLKEIIIGEEVDERIVRDQTATKRFMLYNLGDGMCWNFIYESFY